ncbi:hypothetical protein HDV05_003357 [Chytridiales sp. JEL 0842]|nr:hypothetical protein HDV05_003357 [Chytridiales sp. JEL 0842]
MADSAGKPDKHVGIVEVEGRPSLSSAASGSSSSSNEALSKELQKKKLHRMSLAKMRKISSNANMQSSSGEGLDEEDEDVLTGRPKVFHCILQLLDNFKDASQLGAVCKDAQRVFSNDEIMGQWLLHRHGSHQALYTAYRTIPGRLSMRLIRALLAGGAKLPRYLVLCLARERDAQEATTVQMKNHLAYRHDLHDQLETRTRALEEQRHEAMKMQQEAIARAEKMVEERRIRAEERLAGGGTATEDEEDLAPIPPVPTLDEFMAVLPLPHLPELRVVPPPEPLPITATNYLPPGSQELLISLGTELYGNVFPPQPAPPNNDMLSSLPDALKFLSRLPHNSNNPALQWPPDDALTFAYLIRLAASPITIGKPNEQWAKVCEGIRALVDTYHFVPNLSIGPQSLALKSYRLAQSDLLGQGQNTVGSESANSNAPLAQWLPGEMFLYDSALAEFLAKHGGISEEDIRIEMSYWKLIQSKVHILPKKYTPSLPGEEEGIIKFLQNNIPSPIPLPALRRLLAQHASPVCIFRLKKIVPDSTLQFLGEAIVSDLLGVPSNYAGMALKSADMLISAFGLDMDAIERCILVPNPPASYNPNLDDTTTKDPTAFEDVDLGHQFVDDVMSSYVDISSPGYDVTSTLPKELRDAMWTRLSYSSGSIPWAYWKWALDRFQPTHRVASACLNDLILRHIAEDTNAESRWQFADNEANTSVKDLLARGVTPFMQTVVEVTKRILMDLKVRHVNMAAVEVGGVPARFVMVLAHVERKLLGLAGDRIVPPPNESGVRRVSIDTKLAGVMERFANPGSMSDGARKPEDVLFTEDIEVEGHHQQIDNEKNEELHKKSQEIIARQIEDTQAVWADIVPLETEMEGGDDAEERFEDEDENGTTEGRSDNGGQTPKLFEPPPLEMDAIQNDEIKVWAHLIYNHVIQNEVWRKLIKSELTQSGPWPTPSVRFYNACYFLLKNVTDLHGIEANMFANWEAEWLDKLPTPAPFSNAPSAVAPVPVSNASSGFLGVGKPASPTSPRSPLAQAPATLPVATASDTNATSPTTVNPVVLSEVERQKQTWDRAWNRLSGRLSTMKLKDSYNKDSGK